MSDVMTSHESVLRDGPTLLVFAPTAEEVPPMQFDAAIRQVPIDWSAQPDPEALAQAFAIRSLPWYVLIGADEKIIAIGQTAAIVDQVPEPPEAPDPPEVTDTPDTPDAPIPPADPATAEPDAGAGVVEGLDLDDPQTTD